MVWKLFSHVKQLKYWTKYESYFSDFDSRQCKTVVTARGGMHKVNSTLYPSFLAKDNVWSAAEGIWKMLCLEANYTVYNKCSLEKRLEGPNSMAAIV